MGEEKKQRIIKVDELVIHADKVTIIDPSRDDHHKRDHNRRPEPSRRGPWDFFWGRRDREYDRDEDREREDFEEHK